MILLRYFRNFYYRLAIRNYFRTKFTMPYDVYESKGYAKEGYIQDRDDLARKRHEHMADKNSHVTLTSSESSSKLTERQIEKQNMRALRTEYNRYVSPKGAKNFLTNPLIPLGIGTAVFSLVYAFVNPRDTQTSARMLSWRVHAQAFTIAAIVGGAYLNIRAERNWVLQEAKQRNIAINSDDLSISVSRWINKFLTKGDD